LTCKRAAGLIEALMDGELDLGQRDEVEAHLETCEGCAASLKRLRQMSNALHGPSLRFEPSDGFEERVIRAVRQEARTIPVRQWRPVWMWTGLAACAVLALTLGITLVKSRPAAGDTELIAAEVVSSHVRSLMGSHLMDVPSTDQHTVKPWFDGKLDFSPKVTDFAGEGFRLIGGRLDYIGGRPVAALVYQRGQHVVNLFTWPTQEQEVRPTMSRVLKGYQSVHWSHSGMNYWAVADVPEATLQQFAQLYLR
jgi:anti-sigma factor RsiW